MSDLRNKVIRLAHQNPELRPHLLPLVKEASISENQLKMAFSEIQFQKLDRLAKEYERETRSSAMLRHHLNKTVKDMDYKFLTMWSNTTNFSTLSTAYLKQTFNSNIEALSQALKKNNSYFWYRSFARSGLFKDLNRSFAEEMLVFLRNLTKNMKATGLSDIDTAFRKTFPSVKVKISLIEKDIAALTGQEIVGSIIVDVMASVEKDPHRWYIKHQKVFQ